MVAAAVVIAAAKSPAPSPSAAPGPCAQGSLASISDRPGLGRAPASNGAALPNLVARFGLNGNNEVLAQVPTLSQRSGRDLASRLIAAITYNLKRKVPEMATAT